MRRFLARFDGAELEVALEATTGWRFLVEEIERVGADVHLAEPAETSGLKGKKQRAKTDWADARHLRELLLIGRLPESWIAPAHLLDLRARVRCRHTLVHQRTEWQRRMHARALSPRRPARPQAADARKPRTDCRPETSGGGTGAAHDRLGDDRRDRARRSAQSILRCARMRVNRPGCRTLIDQIYGIGPLTSVTLLAELGDPRRFQNSRDAVRYSGLDITVYQSDQRRAAGHLSRQGPPALRWALYEAAQAARRPSSPDRPYYEQLAKRIGGNRACIAVARKLLKRSYHLLRGLGDQALEPVTA